MQIQNTPNTAPYQSLPPQVSAYPGAPAPTPYSTMSTNLAMQLLSAFQLLSTGWGNFIGAPAPMPQPRPFFENFLEDQNRVRGPQPDIAVTQAYPSDSDHDNGPVRPGPGIVVTQAYPSDSDADNGPVRPGPGPGISVTMAYPSDSDLDTTPPVRPGPGISVTMAFPSDSDLDVARPQ